MSNKHKRVMRYSDYRNAQRSVSHQSGLFTEDLYNQSTHLSNRAETALIWAPVIRRLVHTTTNFLTSHSITQALDAVSIAKGGGSVDESVIQQYHWEPKDTDKKEQFPIVHTVQAYLARKMAPQYSISSEKLWRISTIYGETERRTSVVAQAEKMVGKLIVNVSDELIFRVVDVVYGTDSMDRNTAWLVCSDIYNKRVSTTKVSMRELYGSGGTVYYMFRTKTAERAFTKHLARKYKECLTEVNNKRKHYNAEVRQFILDKLNINGRVGTVSEANRRAYGKELAALLGTAAKLEKGDTELGYDAESLANSILSTVETMRSVSLVNRDAEAYIYAKLRNIAPSVAYYLFICDDCNLLEARENCNDVDGASICQSCIDEHYCWSEYDEEYVHGDYATPLYDTMRAMRRGEPSGWVHQDRDNVSGYTYYDGAWLDTDQYYEYVEQDEDSDDDDSGLSGYHDSRRNFVERAVDKRFVPLGVELEVYAEERREAVMAVRGEFGDDLYFERDGSLDDYHGFEIITQPLGKTEWADYAPKLLDVLTRKGVVGYNHPDTSNSYGIHISVNRNYLSPLQEARMSMFLTAHENSAFVRSIAQRERIYGGESSRQIGSIYSGEQKIRNIGGINQYHPNKKIYGMGKYSPLNLKDYVAECRIFQSTLHTESFVKNLEFMWALVEWTSVKTASGSSWMHTDFVKWLCARPDVEVDYPYLLAYLRRPQYRVKRGNGVIKNTWLELMPKETTKSKPVEQLEEEAADA